MIALLALTACGGGGAGTSSQVTGPAQVSGTLAYVETECRGTKEGLVEHQALRIRQGDREPVTVFETPEVSVPGVGLVCQGVGRLGDVTVSAFAFQSVTVGPDGASVVFEVSDEFSVNPPLPLHLQPDQKGIFWVRADGTGLRQLGPPSRERFFSVTQTRGVVALGGPSFSPDGRTIAFVDKVRDTEGHEADQVVTVDVATGTRTQVTHLPAAVPASGWPVNTPTVFTPLFIDERTIRFYASANPDGLNPEGLFLLMTIRTDGSGFDVPLPVPVALGGSTIELRFVITGDRPQAIIVVVPGKPTNDPPLEGLPQEIREIFVIDEGKNILQLTNFRRVDTTNAFVDVDREHVYFTASADPLGTNPSGNCQMFSIDRTGADLRQLTNFRETEHSVVGCYFNRLGLGCALAVYWQDPRSRALLFYSNCNPLGTNPNGGQIFAMQPDGSGLRQLTDSRGLVREAPSVYSGEIAGPWAYGPYLP